MTKPGKNDVRRRTKKKRLSTRQSVLKMLAVMSESGEDLKNLVDDFLTSGRTGRRNALPDILGEHSLTTTADLPDKLSQLSTKDPQATTSSDQTQGSNPPAKEDESKRTR